RLRRSSDGPGCSAAWTGLGATGPVGPSPVAKRRAESAEICPQAGCARLRSDAEASLPPRVPPLGDDRERGPAVPEVPRLREVRGQPGIVLGRVGLPGVAARTRRTAILGDEPGMVLRASSPR